MEKKLLKSFKDLTVWQKADELAFQIYAVTNQMRRAAFSVPANIAEGYARSSFKEKTQFYIIARGSLTELEYYIDFSLRLKYVIEEQHRELANLRNEVGRLLNGLIQSVKA